LLRRSCLPQAVRYAISVLPLRASDQVQPPRDREIRQRFVHFSSRCACLLIVFEQRGRSSMIDDNRQQPGQAIGRGAQQRKSVLVTIAGIVGVT
jgi:hypothetical protein